MPNLQDRTVLLTGAAGGIGRVLAKALLESGAAVVAADVDAAGLDRLGQAENLVIRVLDIADPAACETAVRETAARFGTLDILVNNDTLGIQILHKTCMTDLVRIDEITPAF